MKKILFLLVLISSYAFSVGLTQAQFSGKLATGNYILVSASSSQGVQTTSNIMNQIIHLTK